MKKFSSILLVSALFVSVFAAPVAANNVSGTVVVEFMTAEQDTYSDGEPVLNGETYAVVWTKSPDTEVNLDETFESDDDVKVLVNAPMAKDGYCPRISLQLDRNFYQENDFETGYFRLFVTNVLRKKENSTIPFEITEAKVTVKICSKTADHNPATAVSDSAIKLDKIVIAGDWAVLYGIDISDKNQTTSVVLIQPKKSDSAIIRGVIATVLSAGNSWIIIACAVLALGGVAALITVKKKKSALADGAEKTGEG